MSAEKIQNSYMTGPDEKGHFGLYGGRYVAETLMPLIMSVEQAYKEARTDEAFWEEFDELARDYIGRPSPLYFAKESTVAMAARSFIRRWMQSWVRSLRTFGTGFGSP